MADAIAGQVNSHEVNFLFVNGSFTYTFVPPTEIPPSGEVVCVSPETRTFPVAPETREFVVPGRRIEPCL